MLLETRRLLIRPMNAADAAGMYELNLDKTTLLYTGDKPFKSVTESATFVKNYTTLPDSQWRQYSMGRHTVLTKENTYLGWCGFKKHDNGVVDIGYRFLKSQWGKGYATEAVNRLIKHGFTDLKLQEIVAHIHEDNIASQKVALKTGMYLDHTFLWEGKLPARCYKITRENYEY